MAALCRSVVSILTRRTEEYKHFDYVVRGYKRLSVRKTGTDWM